ncbi:hypothetical protein [Dactylosporangium sp. NPDC000521]|uniref:hypothetical protein n=1 Tax=Dactylosporangium sp. NPDC000521 TaxID=3363975 RepID=UPI0036A7A6ED
MSRFSAAARNAGVVVAVFAAGLVPCLGAVIGLGQGLRWVSETLRQPPGPPIAAPDPGTLPRAVDELDRAASARGLCFGWLLTEVVHVGAGTRTRDVSTGSNAGVGVRVTDDAQHCPRWIELRVTMTYRGRGGIHPQVTVATGGVGGPLPAAAQLARLGFDGDAFKRRPAATTVAAAVALPLAVAEVRGEAALPAGTATGPPASLPEVDGDFRRDRGAALTVAGLLLLAGGAGAGLLVHARRRAAARSRPAPARRVPQDRRPPAAPLKSSARPPRP